MLTLKCKNCVVNITRKINKKQSFVVYNIIDLKNNGSLVYASHDVYKIVCAIKTELLMTIGTNNNKLPKKDAISKIIYRITRRYAITRMYFVIAANALKD